MNKILLIVKREYLTRVKKKSFLIMTLLTPLLFAAIIILPGYFATKESKEAYKVAVLDRSTLFLGELDDSQSTKIIFIEEEDYPEIKANLGSNEYYALLDVPENILITNKVMLYSKKQISIDVKNHIDRQIERKLENQKRAELIERVGVPDLEEQLSQTRTRIDVETIKLQEDGKGKKGATEIAMGIGYGAGFLIYMFVFLYGNMVMRGVLEEKQNRIVEVIISSVKPVQLMMGKIIGLAAVGLTQFFIWIILIAGIFTGAKTLILPGAEGGSSMTSPESVMMQNEQLSQMMGGVEMTEFEENFANITQQLESINFTEIILYFLIFFILGYLLYSSLMAAVASAVDSEEDMQQFMLPITIPLIAAIVMLVNVIKNPEGQLAFWGSHIPFTSPILMMVRIPFGVAWWEVAISIGTLFITTLALIWVAAKIYRTGILMYGKKPTWKELGKWLTYKN